MRFLKSVFLLCLLAVAGHAQTSNLWRPQPNPTPPPCPQIRQFYNVSGSFQQIDCNGVITTISAGANLQDPGANGFVVRTAINTTVARTLAGTVNRIVLTNPDGVAGATTFDIGSTVATSGNNLSFFAATLSAQFAGVISDETGSGSLVFNSSPTIVTPTIASFANATHNHESAAGGGQLNASNVFSVGAVTIARGGTGASLVDPNAHRLLGWDDTDNAVRFFVIGSGLSYDAGTDTLSVSVGGLGDPGANGIVARTALNTTFARTLQQPAAGFTIGNPNGVGGDPTFTLANDLGALEALGSTGFAVRAAADTWATRTITGTAGQITVVDGSGASGNPTLSLPTIVFLGTPGGTPAAGRLKGPDASGTNIAGANLELAGGPGTGNAAQGLAVFRYPLTAASGSSLQTLSTASFPPWVNFFVRHDNSVVVSNTTTETSLMGSPMGGSTSTIEAGLGRLSRIFLIRMWGTMSATGTPTLEFKVKLGSTVLATTGAVTLANNTNTGNGGIYLEAFVNIRTVGSSALLNTFPLRVDYTVAPGGAKNSFGGVANATVDLTVAQAFDVTAQWGTANVSNVLTASILVIDMSR